MSAYIHRKVKNALVRSVEKQYLSLNKKKIEMIKKEYFAPMRWGIIGCGDVTEFKSGPAYQKTVGFELKKP